MEKNLRCFILLFSLVAVTHSANSQTYVSPGYASVLQTTIDSFVAQNDLPGISVSLLLPGDQYWNGVSGESNIYSHVPMDTSHLFQMASVTKMYATAVIFQMIEQGLLHLDDTVGMYLPAMTNVPSSTTITNLLKHRSGIYNFTNTPGVSNEWFSRPDSIWPPILTIETFVDTPNFAQGQSFEYSNTNFVLLGMIIEQITGNSFATELRNRILIPYGLNQTFFPPEDSIAGPETPGWTSFTTPNVYNTNASAILNDCSASMAFTAGALVAKPGEAARFTRLLWSGQIVSDSTLNIMKQCTNVNFGGGCTGYGYGTMRYAFNGKIYYGHAGDISGFTELSIHSQEDSVTLTLSVNRNSAPRGPMANDIFTLLAQLITEITAIESGENAFSVYPNPATDRINIQIDSDLKECEITVINQLGIPVILEPNALNHQISLDVSNLSSGIYFVRVNAGGKVFSKRVFIK